MHKVPVRKYLSDKLGECYCQTNVTILGTNNKENSKEIIFILSTGCILIKKRASVYAFSAQILL